MKISPKIENLGVGRYMKCLVEAILAQGPWGDYVLILPPGGEAMIQAGASRAKTARSTFHAAVGAPCPAVVTIHDVIPVVWKDDLRSRIGRSITVGWYLSPFGWAADQREG